MSSGRRHCGHARDLLDDVFFPEMTDDDWEDTRSAAITPSCGRTGRLVAHASVVPRRLEIAGGRPLQTGYVEAVAVLRRSPRGFGHGAAVMKAIEGEIVRSYRSGGARVERDRVRFYRARGWQGWQDVGPYAQRARCARPRKTAGSTCCTRGERFSMSRALICGWRSRRRVVSAVLPVTSLVPQQLMDQAIAETGLSDFGPADFHAGLDAYCESASSEAQLNGLGEMAVGAFVTENLRRRLKLIDYAKTHPQVREERIEAPIIVVGMFRAGTTLLSHLLDQDPNNRSLLNWEAADNVPPPTPQTWRADHGSMPCARA